MAFLPESGAASSFGMSVQPLRVEALLDHAARVHPRSTVTTAGAAGTSKSLSYPELAEAAGHVAVLMQAAGFRPGDRIFLLAHAAAEVLAWTYGAARLGVVPHFANPGHGAGTLRMQWTKSGARWLLHDAACEALALECVAGGDEASLRRLDMASAPALRAGLKEDPRPEGALALVCYSSGTTGLPKVVAFTHRSTVLHAFACALPDAMCLASSDRVMPLVQPFHAAAWAAPFACPLVGASLVLVPPSAEPAQWYEWIEVHRVTVLGAVTAQWRMLLAYMEQHNLHFSTLRRTVVAGTRMPPAVATRIVDRLGVEVRQAWGMTETSPLATIGCHGRVRETAHGRPVFGVQVAVRNWAGTLQPGGMGELMVRGHWVATPGWNGEWLSTGDLAMVHADGGVEVVDRLCDVVHGTSGPLSSALVEYEACVQEGVADAALLAMEGHFPHGVLAWVARDGSEPARIVDGLRQRLATAFDGWNPDRFVRVDALPFTSSAKVRKTQLKAELLAAGHLSAPNPGSGKPARAPA
ncbi:AMP-binding protein [Lysobacter sp. SG-8]|uniref:AMP-binding protein n=2 Tax=Marilutibacter penaei TaxID=2759900 RepID=A0A7W3U2W8_9GAMM|nr:AMP-binding protein [Lysobacter penaei]